MSLLKLPQICIFISSPGDVVLERNITFDIISKLNGDPLLRKEVILKPVGWDLLESRVPFSASEPPQADINQGLPKPSQCEIVVVILWMRFGSPQPDNFEKKPDGTRYMSGTEYEFTDAITAATKSNHKPQRPQVLVYRRQPITLLENDHDYAEKLVQLKRVTEFFENFKAPDGSVKGGINCYADPEEFTKILENDIRYLVKLILDSSKRIDVTTLFEAIVQNFSLDELEVLCMRIEAAMAKDGWKIKINLDVIGKPGSLELKATQLIRFFENRDALRYLIDVVHESRPGLI